VEAARERMFEEDAIVNLSQKALMLTTFWDANGMILVDFAEAGVRINSEYYSRLVLQARKLRRKSRVCGLSMSSIEGCGLCLLAHLPYSPDLAPSDYHLFNHLKRALRGQHFATKEDLKDAVSNFFAQHPPKFFEKAFLDLVVRWKNVLM
jgi:[histone H3]-lysine36 N-dimethyltransferase SETMAR